MFLILLGMLNDDQHSTIHSVKQPVMRVPECEACVVGFQQTPNLECGVDTPPTSVISETGSMEKLKWPRFKNACSSKMTKVQYETLELIC